MEVICALLVLLDTKEAATISVMVFKKKKRKRKKIRFFLFLLFAGLCGNNICEPELLENCISCPYDCRNATCGKLIHFNLSYIFYNIYFTTFLTITLFKTNVEMEFATITKLVSHATRTANKLAVCFFKYIYLVIYKINSLIFI